MLGNSKQKQRRFWPIIRKREKSGRGKYKCLDWINLSKTSRKTKDSYSKTRKEILWCLQGSRRRKKNKSEKTKICDINSSVGSSCRSMDTLPRSRPITTCKCT